jgi:hypothetical protein
MQKIESASGTGAGKQEIRAAPLRACERQRAFDFSNSIPECPIELRFHAQPAILKLWRNIDVGWG